MTGNDILADVYAILVESGSGVHWVDSNIMLWINEGGRDIANFKPKAVTQRELIDLTANVTKQANPENVIQVLDLICDMGVDGNVPGRGITTVAEDRLRAVKPSWRADKGDYVKHLVVDDRDPGFFIVWPAPKVARKVEAIVQKQWTPITALGQTLVLDETYRNALVAYVLHCAYGMEGEEQNAQLSAGYYGKYAGYMGIQVSKQKKASAPANAQEQPTQPMVDKNAA